MSKLIRGVDILIDNWLLMVVAGFLNRQVEPTEQWGWIGVQKGHTIDGEIDAGVFQLDSLVNLIEQLVFTNSINVIRDWIPSWSHMNTELNQLLVENDNQIIVPVDFNKKLKKSSSYWLKQLLSNKELEEKVKKGNRDYKKKVENSPFKFWSQIVGGTADYLAIAEDLDLTYSPHPAKSGFLRSGKWQSIISDLNLPEGTTKFNRIIDKKRIKVQTKVRGTDILNQLSIQIPSIAMLCIAESTESQSPIEIALELRNNSEMKKLRQFLHELTKSANEEIISDVIEKEKFMKEVINNVEKELSDTKKIDPRRDITQISLDYFHCKELNNEKGVSTIDSRSHSGLLSRLLLTSSKRTDRIIREKLKIGHGTIHKYNSWVNGEFFVEKQNQIIMKKPKIHIGDNINTGNAEIVGSGNKLNIDKNKINQKIDASEVNNIDINSLGEQLEKLLATMELIASETDHHDQCLIVSKSISQVKKGKKAKALSILKKAGKWTFDTATQIGAGLVVEILKTGML